MFYSFTYILRSKNTPAKFQISRFTHSQKNQWVNTHCPKKLSGALFAFFILANNSKNQANFWPLRSRSSMNEGVYLEVLSKVLFHTCMKMIHVQLVWLWPRVKVSGWQQQRRRDCNNTYLFFEKKSS
jgi:hypothetical protein